MSALCFWATVGSLVVVVLGCDENLLPNVGVDEPFAIYGVLSPQLDTQAVRVFLPERTPTLGARSGLEVDVQSINLETGESRRWMDSVVTGSDGQFGHVFWSPFRVEYGTSYQVEAIRRSDGARSFAEVRVPSRVTFRIDETDAPLLDVHLEGDDFRLLLPVAVYDVSRPVTHPETGEFRPVLTYEVAYAGLEQPAENGWTVTFNMIVDATDVNYLYNGELGTLGGECNVMTGHTSFVFLERMGIQAIVGTPGWDPPGGVFDPNVLSQPGVLSNVENGYGFIGAGYELNETLDVSLETVASSCFQYYP